MKSQLTAIASDLKMYPVSRTIKAVSVSKPVLVMWERDYDNLLSGRVGTEIKVVETFSSEKGAAAFIRNVNHFFQERRDSIFDNQPSGGWRDRWNTLMEEAFGYARQRRAIADNFRKLQEAVRSWTGDSWGVEIGGFVWSFVPAPPETFSYGTVETQTSCAEEAVVLAHTYRRLGAEARGTTVRISRDHD